MFLHLLKYKLKILTKPSEELFWTLCFPLILGTLFYIAFGSFMTNSEEFHSIPIAVVKEEENPTFEQVLASLSTEGDQKLFSTQWVDAASANELLLDEKVDGILYISHSITMTVLNEGINQSIIKSVLDEYKQTSEVIASIGQTNPEALPVALEQLQKNIQTNKEITLTNKDNMDTMSSYFFALISMSCLYGCLFGLKGALSIQANLTPLAARRSISPTHKLKLILSDFFSSVIVHYATIVVLLLYLVFGLHINFGNKLGFVFLTALVGSIIGISFGLFIGSISKLGETTKNAIVMGVTMIFCFFGGLMFVNMKDLIERTFPLLNRINPACLISDALYSLSVYSSYDRYFMNMSILVGMAALLCTLSFLIIRRETYASL